MLEARFAAAVGDCGKQGVAMLQVETKSRKMMSQEQEDTLSCHEDS